MDAEKSFTFPFEDREWISKLGLGAIITLVPILNFAWSGYMVEIIRNVMNDDPEPLPAWDNLGEKLREGLILFGAVLIYTAPVLIALLLPLGITTFSGSFSRNSSMQDLSRMLTEAGGVLFLCLLCLFFLYGLAFSIIYPAILVIFSREGTFASCFKLREAFDLIRKNAGLFFTAWALSLVASLGAGLLVGFVNLVVGFVPCIGWIISFLLSFGSVVYANVVYAHLFGQFSRAFFEGSQLLPTA
ncbi:MAG TPA: DUF4013 domain-containing protein [Anaerolineales bacterium]|nr:DUF4013 domain-containing protein [Anaerolineales bacterium]